MPLSLLQLNCDIYGILDPQSGISIYWSINVSNATMSNLGAGTVPIPRLTPIIPDTLESTGETPGILYARATNTLHMPCTSTDNLVVGPSALAHSR